MHNVLSLRGRGIINSVRVHREVMHYDRQILLFSFSVGKEGIEEMAASVIEAVISSTAPGPRAQFSKIPKNFLIFFLSFV